MELLGIMELGSLRELLDDGNMQHVLAHHLYMNEYICIHAFPLH